MALTNAQYDSIMHEYEYRRALHRQELEERLKIVYDTVPGYKELEDEVASASVAFGKRLLSGEKLDKSVLTQQLQRIADTKLSLLTEAGYSRDYLDMGYTCSDCKDTGYIGNEKCHCFKQRIADVLYDNSNLRALSKTANFKNLSEKYYQGQDLQHFLGAKRAAEDFIKNFGTDYQNLLIYGTVGTGKSFLSICVANEIIKKGHSVIFYSAKGMFDMISQYTFDHGRKQELAALYDDLYNCELLVLDDLGSEMTNNFVASELFNLLNERFNRKKPIVITSNYDLDNLQNTYSDRIFSRILTNFKVLKLSGPDIRKLKKIAQKESEEMQ